MIIKPALELPDSLLSDISKGRLFLDGGVVRSTANGQLVKLLDFAPTNSNEQTLSPVSQPNNSISTSELLCGIVLTTAGIAAVGVGIYKIVEVVKKKKEEKKVAEQKEEYYRLDKRLTTYLNNAISGNINLLDVNNAIADLDEYKQNFLLPDSSVDYSKLASLRSSIVYFTLQLYVMNGKPWDDKLFYKKMTPTDSLPQIIDDFHSALFLQKKLLSAD